MAKAPAAIGPYSQAIRAGHLIFCSGQIPVDPTTGSVVSGGIREQTTQSLINLKAVLHAAGADLGQVAKTTVFLQDMNDFVAMNEVYASVCAVCLFFYLCVCFSFLENGNLLVLLFKSLDYPKMS